MVASKKDDIRLKSIFPQLASRNSHRASCGHRRCLNPILYSRKSPATRHASCGSPFCSPQLDTPPQLDMHKPRAGSHATRSTQLDMLARTKQTARAKPSCAPVHMPTPRRERHGSDESPPPRQSDRLKRRRETAEAAERAPARDPWADVRVPVRGRGGRPKGLARCGTKSRPG